MKAGDLLSQFRLGVDDTEKTYLWSDPEVLAYMDDAQKMFCRLTDGLGDASSPITQLPIVIGVEWIDLSDLVLKVRGAIRTSDGRDLTLVNFEDLDRRHLRFDGRVGQAKYLILGMEENKARVYPVPNVSDTAQLTIFRLPLKSICKRDDCLEIDSRHHLHLLWWMKHLAYNKQDSETLDRTKAADSKAIFEAYCFQVKNEQAKARHKTRVVTYGGL